MDAKGMSSPIPEYAAADIPDECADVGEKRLLFNRTGACYRKRVGFEIFNPQTQKVTGSGVLNFAYSSALDVRSRTWKEHTVVRLDSPLGTAAEGGKGSITIACPEQGSSSPCTFTPSVNALLPAVEATFSNSVTSPGTDITYRRPKPVLTLTANAASNPLVWDVTDGTNVRCDSNPGGGMAANGCVYFNYAPSYVLRTDNADTDSVAWHVLWAQRNLDGQWGWKGHGVALQRLIDPAIQTLNREKACGDAPSIPDKSCDEYPFASTYQGAHFVGTDYSCHMLNATDNELEGSRYRRPWYNDNSLIDGDKFWVEVSGPGTTSAGAQAFRAPVGCGIEP